MLGLRASDRVPPGVANNWPAGRRSGSVPTTWATYPRSWEIRSRRAIVAKMKKTLHNANLVRITSTSFTGTNMPQLRLVAATGRACIFIGSFPQRAAAVSRLFNRTVFETNYTSGEFPTLLLD